MTFRIHSLTEPWQAQVCHDWGGDGPDGTGYGGGPTGGTGTGGIGRGDAGIGPGGGAAGTFGGFGFNGYMGQGLAQAMANIMGVNRNFNLPAAAPKVSPTTVAPKYKTVTTYTKVPVYKTVSVPTTQVATPSFNPSTLGVMTNPQVMHEVQKLVGYNNVPQSMRVAVAADQPTAGLALSQNLGAWANDKLSQNAGFNNYGVGLNNGGISPGGYKTGGSISGPDGFTTGGFMGDNPAKDNSRMSTNSPAGGMMSGAGPLGAQLTGNVVGPGSYGGAFGAPAPVGPPGYAKAPSLNSFGLPQKDMGVLGVPGGMIAKSQVGPSIANSPAFAAPKNLINKAPDTLGLASMMSNASFNAPSEAKGLFSGQTDNSIAANPKDQGVMGVPGGLAAKGTTVAQAAIADPSVAQGAWAQNDPMGYKEAVERVMKTGTMFNTKGLTSQQANFVNDPGMISGVLQAANVTGLSPGTIMGQVVNETAWGKSVVAKNLFNVKATPSWKGDVAVNPKVKSESNLFRAYSSYAQSFADYARVMLGSRYAPVRAAVGIDAQAEALGMSPYAPNDKRYGSTVGNLGNRLFGNR